MFNKEKLKTPTDELVDYIVIMAAEDPDIWECNKHKTKRWWYSYKDVGIFLNVDDPGLLQDTKGTIGLTNKQRKKIKQATIDLRSNQMLHEFMKASVKNVE